MTTMTTANGTVIEIDDRWGRKTVNLSSIDHAEHYAAGHIITTDEGTGYQPYAGAPFILGPSTLRALADLIEKEPRP